MSVSVSALKGTKSARASDIPLQMDDTSIRKQNVLIVSLERVTFSSSQPSFELRRPIVFTISSVRSCPN